MKFGLAPAYASIVAVDTGRRSADKRWTPEYRAVPTLEGLKRGVAPNEE